MLSLLRKPNIDKLKRQGNISKLIATLRHEDWRIGNHAAEALVEIGSPAVPSLCAALSHVNTDTRRRAMFALGAIGDRNATAALCLLLHPHTSHFLLQHAIEAIGTLGDPAAVPALQPMLAHDDRDVCHTAVHALGAIGGPAAAEALCTFIRGHGHVNDLGLHSVTSEALVAIGEAAVDPLCRALPRASIRGRQIAVSALGRLGDARAIDPLRSLLACEFDMVADAAADSLRRLGHAGSR